MTRFRVEGRSSAIHQRCRKVLAAHADLRLCICTKADDRMHVDLACWQLLEWEKEGLRCLRLLVVTDLRQEDFDAPTQLQARQISTCAALACAWIHFQ